MKSTDIKKSMNLLKTVTIVVFILASFQHASAQNLKAIAFGDTQEMARESALSDLSSRISVLVTSTEQFSESEISGEYTNSFTKSVLTKSELPLLGVEFAYQKSSTGIECTATMTSTNSKRLYETQIGRLVSDIKQQVERTPISEQSIDRLMALKNALEQLRKLEIAGSYFGISSVEVLPVTLSAISEAISARAEAVNTWDDLLSIFKNQFSNSGEIVMVSPPIYEGNPEITSFAKTLRDRISTVIQSTDSPNKAAQFLKGTYRLTGDQLEFVLRLTDKENNSLDGFVYKLNPDLYDDYSWKPESNSLDQLIEDGVVVSSDLTIQLSTNKGKSDLLFTEGETVELLVKSNQSVYVYFVGHNTSTANKFSYLLPLGYGETKRDMVLFINADDVNKWVSLGEFEVVPPFGVERLQAFASTEDLVDSLPEYYWNEEGYPEIGKDPNAALVQTRGLLKKKESKAANAETSINFTTLDN